ncbi:3-oxoacyl-[acyl-carrier-protein] synthase III C-terminal domain-containing protein [Deinococcus sp.]|uniref:3-oxoacyl-[acyl-carrier-protein] synthase III C-terminal domain-containing protein n=1 Tax=Deinococcus sp. TaxID=47478 RepID=UPI002869D795|nr:3-oxoacyl-[acyl-carrier-protein] synthase III C-terminal domain-containing protein [Deinococcus sp.]
MILGVRLLATAEALAHTRVPTAEVAARCGLETAEAIRRSGVEERPWIDPALGESALTLGAEAARRCCATADVPLGDIDTLINASGTPMQPIPDGSALLAHALGLRGLRTQSVHSTCLSFLAGLELGALLVHTGRARRVLVIASDHGSVGLNFAQPESALLIGDGAAAALLGPADHPQQGLRALAMLTWPEGVHHTEIRAGGSLLHPSRPDCAPGDTLFDMQGLEVLKLALRTVPTLLQHLGAQLGHDPLEGVHRIIPHQASAAALHAMTRLGWHSRLEVTLPETGNLIAASIPVALHRAIESGRLRAGQRALLLGTGAGLITGGAIIDL